MKSLFFLSLICFHFQALALSAIVNCMPGQVKVWRNDYWGGSYHCANRFPAPEPTIGCFPTQLPHQTFPDWTQNFPPVMYQFQIRPWWAYQGSQYYPNVYSPGIWSYPGINGRYYNGSWPYYQNPNTQGNGQVHLLKPNIYVESIHKNKKFKMRFENGKDVNFHQVTPQLNESFSWEGKVTKDFFNVDGTVYDYLFYDAAIPMDKLQFEKGFCATRKEAIEWMVKDLKEMSYPKIALQDFEEHWWTKIKSEYPYYCVYPQYNEQLDQAIPLTIELEQSVFTRSLYILVPYESEPDPSHPQMVQLPHMDPEQIRPKVQIKRENHFREWGVAFFDKLAKP